MEALRPETRERFAVFLAANERVPVADPVLKPILAQIRRTAGSDDHAVRSSIRWRGPRESRRASRSAFPCPRIAPAGR